ncbi:TRAP transporter small permease (plasmid) [Paroceanicella profunda]|uniref:TRAP transporter small permease protein n=1 Tax=Paroceanicella profunda TaxID=2579971 RepID=A0A5B8FJ80_9RHOB|nr:TRAP transporter small permease subunit [Paroceanicella profunda]QDL93938.1 TRAP transporter small permease [Paroceanicella profunda]
MMFGRGVFRLLGAVSTLGLWLGMGLLFLITALIVLQVVARNLFNLGLPWADEGARFCGIALVYLCVPWLALRGRHIAVDLVSARLTGGWRRGLMALTELAVLGFAGIVLHGFSAFLERAAKFATPAMGMPNSIFYAPAVAGFVMLGLIALARLLTLLAGGAVEESGEGFEGRV